MKKTTVTQEMNTFHQLKCHMVGMSKGAKEESGNMIISPAVEAKLNCFGTNTIPSITTTLKSDFLLKKFSSSYTISQ